jgi:GNAT superfamily N-acetyltransferase
MSDDLLLRTYRPGDENGLQELLAAVYGPSAVEWRSLGEWRWRFQNAPRGPAYIQIVERSGEIVGHYAHVPFDIYVNGRKVLLGHGGDMMVRPDHRERGLMKVLVEGYLSGGMGYDVRINFPTEQAARLGERYGGGRLLGTMTDRVRPARIRRFGAIGRALGLSALIERFIGSFAGRPIRGVRVSEEVEPNSEFDDLAARSAGFATCIRVRDAAYVRWRWFDHPGFDWRLLSARDRRGKLTGWVAFGIEDGSRPYSPPGGYIADLLAEDAVTTRVLLAAAAARLIEEGANNVSFQYVDPRPWAERACKRAGFLRKRRGHRVLARSLSDRVGSEVDRLDNWFLTKGDTDLA